jgi:hypothetical protein
MKMQLFKTLKDKFLSTLKPHSPSEQVVPSLNTSIPCTGRLVCQQVPQQGIYRTLHMFTVHAWNAVPNHCSQHLDFLFPSCCSLPRTTAHYDHNCLYHIPTTVIKPHHDQEPSPVPSVTKSWRCSSLHTDACNPLPGASLESQDCTMAAAFANPQLSCH